MQKVIVKFTVLLVLFFSGNALLAGTPPPPPPPPSGAPIDAGAIILLVVGVALAVNKIYKNRQQAKLIPAVVTIASK